MTSVLTRRDFLKSAGGITALALTPFGDRVFAAPAANGPRLPLFTALPYLQPGPNSRFVDGRESMVVAWQTLEGAADFVVEYGDTEAYGRSAVCQSLPRAAGHGGDAERRHNWTATLDALS